MFRLSVHEYRYAFIFISCSDEATDDYHKIVGPKFKDLEGIKRIYQRGEVSAVTFENPRRDVKVGEVFELMPPQSDATTNYMTKFTV